MTSFICSQWSCPLYRYMFIFVYLRDFLKCTVMKVNQQHKLGPNHEATHVPSMKTGVDDFWGSPECSRWIKCSNSLFRSMSNTWNMKISTVLWAGIRLHLQFYIHGSNPAVNLNVFHVLHQFSPISASQLGCLWDCCPALELVKSKAHLVYWILPFPELYLSNGSLWKQPLFLDRLMDGQGYRSHCC